MANDERGTFIWHELMSQDPEASEQFYREVVGLEVQTMEVDGELSDARGGRPADRRPDRPTTRRAMCGRRVALPATGSVTSEPPMSTRQPIGRRSWAARFFLVRSTSRIPGAWPCCAIRMARRSAFSTRPPGRPDQESRPPGPLSGQSIVGDSQERDDDVTEGRLARADDADPALGCVDRGGGPRRGPCSRGPGSPRRPARTSHDPRPC